MPLLSKCLSRPIQTLLFFTQYCNCNPRTRISTKFSTFHTKPISEIHPFSLQISGFRSLSIHSVSTPPINVESYEEEETIDSGKLRVLREKIDLLGIKSHSCTPGLYHHLICPKCNGGKSMERSLSFHITENKDFAMWRCFRFDCGWAGQVFAENRGSKVNAPRQVKEESLGLEPLGDKLIAYFADRMISEEVLKRNAVMQISGDENIIAFTYRRNGVLVNCKYRSVDKKYWQEKGAEKILYGLDDIKEADEIIIVEGEIDKLSMEEAGFRNCVSVPDGAPQKVSNKELPPREQDTRFQYLWNCKEYLDKASRIILATDGDIPGQVLAKELAGRLGRERCWQVRWPKKDEFSCFKDANEVLENSGADALGDLIHNAEIYGVHNLNLAI